MVACLGTWNYWLTLPFLALIGGVAVMAIVEPGRLPFPPPGPEWVHRLLGIGMLVLAVTFAVLAVDEARTDPDCTKTTAAAAAVPRPSA